MRLAENHKCKSCLSSFQAQVIAQAIGQAFGVAYQQFLQENGMKATDLKPGEYSEYLESQELYNGDLAHFSDSQNIREVSRCTLCWFGLLTLQHLNSSVWDVGCRHQGSRWDLGFGHRGVWLGFHPAHSGRGQPPARRSCRALRRAQHRWPHHVHQQHQSGGPAHRCLSEHNPGKFDMGRIKTIKIILKIKIQQQ